MRLGSKLNELGQFSAWLPPLVSTAGLCALFLGVKSTKIVRALPVVYFLFVNGVIESCVIFANE